MIEPWSFGEYDVKADRVLGFGDGVTIDDMAPTLDAMRANGEVKPADLIQKYLIEDGAVEGANFYQWLKRSGINEPEYYLRRGGIDAIDTGRDLRVLNPAVVSRK